MKRVLSREKIWAANANGRYGWHVKITYSDGKVEWWNSK